MTLQKDLPPSPSASAGPRAPTPPFDLQKIRADFPLLQTPNLAYLDNAATTQKPQPVIDALAHYYESENANIHRGVYALSRHATEAYEQARIKIQKFIHAADPREVLFTRGTTESINLVAATWGRANLHPGDEVLISGLEHHSNIVPWQIACELSGATLKVIPLNDAGELRLDEFEKLLTPKTKLLALAHLSNSLGTINPVALLVQKAHAVGALVLIDGAQWIAHFPTDVQKLDADFYCFSGHKLLGPTGIGVLYGKRHLLEAMPPYQSGGDMIANVTFAKTTYAELPNKFEAGTPHIAGAIGLAAAIDYIHSIGLDKISQWEHDLLVYATAKLTPISGLRIIGTAARKASVLSFVMENPPIASLDLGQKLDAINIALRTGHHCCQPVMDRFAIASTTRASFAFYNTTEEIDRLADALTKIQKDCANKSSTPRPLNPSTPQLDYASLPWPKPFAPSVTAAAEKIYKSFALFPEAKDKNEYLESLSDKIPHTLNHLRHLTARVNGCMSEVFVVARPTPNIPGHMDLLADSDASTVRGLIAIMHRLFAGQPTADILNFDLDQFFKNIELDTFLTNKRRIGLSGMTAKIHQLARDNAKAAP